MPLQPDEKLVEQVARAIEGPRSPVPASSKFTLEHLRDVRWAQLSRQEQGERLSQARAAIAAISTIQNDDAVEREAVVKWLRNLPFEPFMPDDLADVIEGGAHLNRAGEQP